MRSFKLLSISLLSVLGFVFMLASTASATPVCASVTINVSNSETTAPIYSKTIPLTEIEMAKGSYEIHEGDFDLNLFVDSDIDPYLQYGMVVINNLNVPLTFSGSWSTPVVMGNYPTAVTSSLSYSGNDNGDHLVSVSPAGVNGFVQESSLVVLGNLGVGLQNFTYNLAGVVGSWDGPDGLFESAVGPTGPFSDVLVIDTAFTLSAYDMATVNGRTDIVPTPIPASGVLLLFGLVGMVGIKKKFSLF
ncbi:MAG: hypothetical protein AB1847_14925 [bacterium]